MKKSRSNIQHNVIPMADRVIVTAPPEKTPGVHEEKMVGGIVIPSNAQGNKEQDPYYKATVIAAGPECKSVRNGSEVIVARRDLFHVEIAGYCDAMMIREPNIVAVLR